MENGHDYQNVLNSVIEETQNCEKVKRKSTFPTKLLLLVVLLVVCLGWILIA